jgi:hypothetical protein
MGFEPTFPVFERAKTVHARDRAATVIGKWVDGPRKILSSLRETTLAVLVLQSKRRTCLLNPVVHDPVPLFASKLSAEVKLLPG